MKLPSSTFGKQIDINLLQDLLNLVSKMFNNEENHTVDLKKSKTAHRVQTLIT